MDIFAEFCAEVCKNAPRTTYGEERDLKAELGAHLEDHFEALKLRGVDTRLCLFEGENHELSRSGRPRQRLKWLEEMLAWYNRYLKDMEG